jgi:hypothetical protein
MRRSDSKVIVEGRDHERAWTMQKDAARRIVGKPTALRLNSAQGALAIAHRDGSSSGAYRNLGKNRRWFFRLPDATGPP